MKLTHLERAVLRNLSRLLRPDDGRTKAGGYTSAGAFLAVRRLRNKGLVQSYSLTQAGYEELARSK